MSSPRVEAPEDVYESCSECGYQSICGSTCTCSMAGSLPRSKKGKAKKSSDSSGCSSCECQDCQEQGDVCYSCSIYNESSNAGTIVSRNSKTSDRAKLPETLAAPD